jgi:hypothetical protein
MKIDIGEAALIFSVGKGRASSVGYQFPARGFPVFAEEDESFIASALFQLQANSNALSISLQ